VGIPPRLRDFQAEGESPAGGLFHAAAFSTALLPTNSATEPKFETAFKVSILQQSRRLYGCWHLKGRGHSLRSRKLPPDEVFYTRIPWKHPSRPRQYFHPAYRRTDALRLGSAAPIAVGVNPVLPLTPMSNSSLSNNRFTNSSSGCHRARQLVAQSRAAPACPADRIVPSP
jgi:hypothetical protein